MNALRQLGLLKGLVRRDAEDPEDHRVLALFRNRAELKKAYAALQDEIYRLKDRIKQQEGATLRTQEMLGVLETRLGLSESGFPALVFYQLRRLWQLGRELIEQFVAELARQLEERERRAHIAEHNRRQFARRQEVEVQEGLFKDAVAKAPDRQDGLDRATDVARRLLAAGGVDSVFARCHVDAGGEPFQIPFPRGDQRFIEVVQVEDHVLPRRAEQAEIVQMRIAIDHARFGCHGWARALKDECRCEFGVGPSGYFTGMRPVPAVFSRT